MKGSRPAMVLVALLALAFVGLAGCGSGQGTPISSERAEPSTSNLGKVAYELDGVIYVKSLPDGQVTRVAEGYSPRWSPSGGWLLFYCSEFVCVAHEDGSDLRRLDGTYAVWSPVEDRLAVENLMTIFVENVDGSGRRDLGWMGIEQVRLAWSPDGTRVVFDRVESTGESTNEAGEKVITGRRGSLWTVDVDGSSDAVELYSSTTDAPVVAGWTVDSQYVLFWLDLSFANSVMNDGLPMFSIPASGGEPRKLTSTLISGVWQTSPVDRTDLLITEGTSRMTWTQQRLALANAATGQINYLTGKDTASQQPDWSPDGQTIVFVSQPDRGMGPGGPGPELEWLSSERRIWMMNADGSDLRQLTDEPGCRDERPSWSAGGSQILFARFDEDMKASLWLMSPDGSDARSVIDATGQSGGGMMSYYGTVGWDYLFDWWQPAPQASAPATPIVTFTHPNVQMAPLMSGSAANDGLVTTDDGRTLHLSLSEAGTVPGFEPGERWTLSEADGTSLMSGTVLGEAVQYESVYGFVRLDDGRAVVYQHGIMPEDWRIYPADEVCDSLEGLLRIPSVYLRDGTVPEDALLAAACDWRGEGPSRQVCYDKIDGVVRGIAICVEQLGLSHGLQILP